MAQYQQGLMLRHKYIILPKKQAKRDLISFLFINFAKLFRNIIH